MTSDLRFIKKAAALLLAALLLVPLAACSKRTGSPELEHNISYFYCAEDTYTYFFHDADKLTDRIAGNITRLETADGSSGFVTAATALYRIAPEGILKIYPAAVTNAALSLDGRFILFSTALHVFLYDDEAKEYEEIVLDGADMRSTPSLVLSPDGSAAGIAVVTKDDRIDSYTFVNGKAELLRKDALIAAIGDGGSALYYLEAPNGTVSGRLHSVRNGRDTLVSENASPYFEVNRSLSEITFDVAEKTHISLLTQAYNLIFLLVTYFKR